jgi:hypothetical protein
MIVRTVPVVAIEYYITVRMDDFAIILPAVFNAIIAIDTTDVRIFPSFQTMAGTRINRQNDYSHQIQNLNFTADLRSVPSARTSKSAFRYLAVSGSLPS